VFFSRNSFSISIRTNEPRLPSHLKKQITVPSRINCDPLRAPPIRGTRRRLAGHHSPRLAIPSSSATAGTDPTTWTCTTSPARYSIVKLDSQHLLQVGDAQFYFLLPSRFIFHDGDSEEERKGVAVQEASVSAAKRPRKENPPCWYRNPVSLDLD
jgi:hypothetical protein